MKVKKILVFAVYLFSLMPTAAQHLGIKSNLLYDALLSPSLGLETSLASKWSLDISGIVNLWTINEKRWKQWMVQPEIRYWFCQRYSGSFFGVHALGGKYNFGNLDLGGYNFLGTDLKQLENHRLQGWMAGAGISYGYSWMLDKHWNLEAELGIGWVYTRYDRFKCTGCGALDLHNKAHNYVGPTKAALNVIYYF